ncbi:CotS family spore coat protein [Dehalobacterium formicoaceticum]|uniref:CotS family spore coat protein n=1 Tax=Dehalobacterium formicoaceticum TaxID=51515 RepID=A0ABT1Y4A4_9FIRM|nr:CotS family spore coat protein [Dehalobacterium formicoaceticum]MCR6545326.1 CotS family spore coat protein [Dehalobacterium formicoaceticum]
MTTHKNVNKVFTPPMNYALKRVKGKPESLLFYLSAMEYLWQKGFHHISRICRNQEGGLYVAEGEELYFLTEWIEGPCLDFSQSEQLDLAADVLGSFHRQGAGFIPPADCLPRNDIGRWPDKWQLRIMDLKIMGSLSRGGKNDFDHLFHQMLPQGLRDAEQSLSMLQGGEYRSYCRTLEERKPLCHRDFVYHNLILHQGEVFIIDFEYCVQDSPLVDLARFLRTSFVEQPWEIKTGGRILARYQDQAPLSPAEQTLLLALLVFPHELWRAGHNWYLSGQRKKNAYQLLCCYGEIYHRKVQFWRKMEQGFLSL